MVLSPNLTLRPLVAEGNSLFKRTTFAPKEPGVELTALGLPCWLLIPGPRWIKIRLLSFPNGAGRVLGLVVILVLLHLEKIVNVS